MTMKTPTFVSKMPTNIKKFVTMATATTLIVILAAAAVTYTNQALSFAAQRQVSMSRDQETRQRIDEIKVDAGKCIEGIISEDYCINLLRQWLVQIDKIEGVTTEHETRSRLIYAVWMLSQNADSERSHNYAVKLAWSYGLVEAVEPYLQVNDPNHSLFRAKLRLLMR